MPSIGKKTRKSQRPGEAVTRASYQWNQRRTKVWIPFLEHKIAELRARIREKNLPGEG